MFRLISNSAYTQVPGAGDVTDDAAGGVAGADSEAKQEVASEEQPQATESEEQKEEEEEEENTEPAKSGEAEEGDGPTDVVCYDHTVHTYSLINLFSLNPTLKSS